MRRLRTMSKNIGSRVNANSYQLCCSHISFPFTKFYEEAYLITWFFFYKNCCKQVQSAWWFVVGRKYEKKVQRRRKRNKIKMHKIRYLQNLDDTKSRCFEIRNLQKLDGTKCRRSNSHRILCIGFCAWRTLSDYSQVSSND